MKKCEELDESPTPISSPLLSKSRSSHPVSISKYTNKAEFFQGVFRRPSLFDDGVSFTNPTPTITGKAASKTQPGADSQSSAKIEIRRNKSQIHSYAESEFSNFPNGRHEDEKDRSFADNPLRITFKIDPHATINELEEKKKNRNDISLIVMSKASNSSQPCVIRNQKKNWINTSDFTVENFIFFYSLSFQDIYLQTT